MLAVKLSRPSGQSGSYAGLIGFNRRQLKGLKGDELPRNGPSVYAKYFSSSSSTAPDVGHTMLFVTTLFTLTTVMAFSEVDVLRSLNH